MEPTISAMILLGTGTGHNVTAPNDLPKEVNGLTAHYYWRQSIRDGKYKHPVRGWELSVDKAKREGWVSNFNKMAAAGVEVPIVKDHKEGADSTIGYVKGMKIDGPWLSELHQYLGDEARDVALRNKISVGIDPDFADGAGNKYGESIRHSAVVPTPVVSGSGTATALAASRDQATNVLMFSLDAPKGNKMLTPEQLTKAREVLGADVTEEQVFDKLLEKAATPAPAPQNLSREEEPEMPAYLKHQFRQGHAQALGTLVNEGKITPACRDKLLSITKDDVKLLARSDENTPAFGERLIEALKENKLVPMGNQTHVQTLSRSVEGDSQAMTEEQRKAHVKERAARVSAVPLK